MNRQQLREMQFRRLCDKKPSPIRYEPARPLPPPPAKRHIPNADLRLKSAKQLMRLKTHGYDPLPLYAPLRGQVVTVPSNVPAMSTVSFKAATRLFKAGQ